MKMLLSPVCWLAMAILNIVSGQPVVQSGLFPVSGNQAVASVPGIMLLSEGQVVDISSPGLPTLIGNFSMKNCAATILIHGHLAFYGSDREATLHVADLTDPANPVPAGSVQIKGASIIFSMDIAGNALYLTAGNQKVYTIDISNPAIPEIRDSVETGWVFDLAVRDSFAYVSGYDHGLQIYDLREPWTMKQVASAGFDYYSVELADTLAFLGSDSEGGIDVVSIADPFNPRLVSTIPGIREGPVWDLKFRDGYLYSATRDKGLLIYDTSTGKIAAQFQGANYGECYSVCLQDSLILLSTARKGVAILKFTPEIVSAKYLTEACPDGWLYPNPAADHIYLRKSGSFILSGMDGVIVRQQVNVQEGERVNLAGLPPGVYLARIFADGQVFTVKVIKVLR